MAVYFATSRGYTKIGYAADPFQRIGTVTTNGTRPSDLPRKSKARLIGWVPGSYWDEGALHGRFKDRRVRGEWFRDIDDVEVRDLIWSDPRGVDIKRMSASAVFAMHANPDLSREDLAAAGVIVNAVPAEEAIKRLSEQLTRALAGGPS